MGIFKRCPYENGVPREAILREDQATFTYENAIYSRQVTDREHLNIQKAILCCKACHARRALMYYKMLYPDTDFLYVHVVWIRLIKVTGVRQMRELTK